MGDSIYDADMTRANSDFLTAMEKARQFVDQAKQTAQSTSSMGEWRRTFESAGVSRDKFTGAFFALNKAMGSVHAEGKPSGGSGIGGQDRDPRKKKDAGPNTKGLSINTPDADRWAKLGLFIGGAPQTPGQSEARRTARTTEEACKLLRQVLLKTDHGASKHAVYAE